MSKVTNDDIKAVDHALTEAKKHGLEVEVIAWALNAMKKDNTLTIEQALSIGLEEWDI